MKSYQIMDSYYLTEQTRKKDREYLDIVSNYIKYYHKRADGYRNWYLALSTIKLVALSVIPVMQASEWLSGFPWIAAVASSGCLFVESVTGLFHMRDKWHLYRSVENRLMSEERQYASKKGTYFHDKKRFHTFVENVKHIINEEGLEWKQMMKKAQEQKGG